ncbi:hypothetical protein N7478_010359 [Penicillium angulare]|uniref:uncharacterized protein n=1 Tax=Penicillium angulare TaxID=116970 RepID=UPI00253F6D04|nr:uncharacterized protein N7478_010359 [Penicillium angulare]KAJ5267551.1 hypothetical protein N7478_010359 [Penicillium angulare]
MFGKEDGKLESLKEKVRAILPTNDSDSKSKDYETDSIRTLYAQSSRRRAASTPAPYNGIPAP